ncbi:MAG: TetR/AcrR family transcriptional regulator [Spirochaetes bacterium]|nr:TetR/AcrR family transcriptional regulator [Spirochaetota bacterium]
MRQEKRKELTRAKILQAAKQVFAHNGYAGTSIADIVKKSKLARGTFYLHFQSVEQVLNALLQEVFIDIQRYLTDMQVETLDHKNFKLQLAVLAKSLLSVFQNHRDTVSLLLTTMNAEPKIRTQTLWFQELMQASIRVMLDRGVASGRLKKFDTELMSFLVSGGLREMLTQWLLYGRYANDIEHKVDEMISVYMNGVEKTDKK